MAAKVDPNSFDLDMSLLSFLYVLVVGAASHFSVFILKLEVFW